MRFEIGQTAWRATYEGTEASVECPHCGGTGRLRVMFHDDTQVSIGCANCACGYDPPTGRVRVYDRRPIVRQVTITGVDVRDGVTEWRTFDSYCVKDEQMFDNEADAHKAAQTLAEEADREERERVATKAKDTRSWSWNASYHRKEIKRAQESIAHHTAKLAVASLKAKQKEAAE